MTTAMSANNIAAAFIAACRAELQALKPGNVHIHAAGHGMDIAHFERAAEAATPFIAEAGAPVGQRIRRAVEASVAATGLNTNLGIVLLAAPLAKAAENVKVGMGLRRCLALVLSLLDRQDAEDAFAAIVRASPAGLGHAGQGDVKAPADMTLIQAMQLAADRDLIAEAYVTAYAQVFDIALPALGRARQETDDANLAITTLHMELLAERPDSHIARKYGVEKAVEVQKHAQELRQLWHPAVRQSGLPALLLFDQQLKGQGLNPGTTADFVVATLFTDRLSARKSI